MAAHEAAAKQSSTTPRIYVASLSDYNSGRLVGTWLDSVDPDEVREGIAAMLKTSREPHPEEFAIHDVDNYGVYRPHEYEDLRVVCAIGAAIQEHGTLFADFLGHIGAPNDAEAVAAAVERFEESYQGDFESLAEWAEQHLDDSGTLKEVPESLRLYVDFERWADDAETNGEVFSVWTEGRIHVFSGP